MLKRVFEEGTGGQDRWETPESAGQLKLEESHPRGQGLE